MPHVNPKMLIPPAMRNKGGPQRPIKRRAYHGVRAIAQSRSQDNDNVILASPYKICVPWSSSGDETRIAPIGPWPVLPIPRPLSG
jgi:hypothetical protein